MADFQFESILEDKLKDCYYLIHKSDKLKTSDISHVFITFVIQEFIDRLDEVGGDWIEKELSTFIATAKTYFQTKVPDYKYTVSKFFDYLEEFYTTSKEEKAKEIIGMIP